MNITKIAAKSFLTMTIALSTACSGASIKREITQAGKIYSFESGAEGFNTKNFFYDNGEEVVVFDTQFTPAIARKSIEFIQSKTGSPISYVVITHPNPDKFNGMSEFQKIGAKVVTSVATTKNMIGAHEYKKFYFVNVAKMFTIKSYPELSSVDLTFDKSYDLQLKNGEKVHLWELSNAGVSANQTVAFIPSQSALMVVDLIHSGAHVWLEGGIVNGRPQPTIQGWISDLRELRTQFKDLPATVVYGGRGEEGIVNNVVDAEIRYLKKADRIVSRYVAKLGERRSELRSDQASRHYQNLQKLFEKEFPDYSLAYLIQYGVYGLLNSKM